MLSISAARRLSAGARASRSAIASGRGPSVRSGGSGVGCGGSPFSRRGAVVAPVALMRVRIPSSLYSTERILSLKTGKREGEVLPKTLYAPERETENCGVGMVASLKSVASRKIVNEADEMMIRMSHRGGVGCCPASGDGAGKFLTLSSDVCLKQGSANALDLFREDASRSTFEALHP
jgi:hypothetical protein